MRKSLAVAILIATFGLSQSSYASAIVDEIDGAVSINVGGSGYHNIASARHVNIGDSVITGHHGKAVIVYDNGCRVVVNPGERIIIQAKPPCATSGTAYDIAGFALGTGAVAGGVALILENNRKPASP